MKYLTIWISFLLSGVIAFDSSDQFINEINHKQKLWKAGRNFPKSTSLLKLRRLLGVKQLPKYVFGRVPIRYHEASDEIPESFDARVKWPHCKTISQIADQSACASSWAVSVASAISDRTCIHSNGEKQPEISSRPFLGCLLRCDGCNGGHPYYAWYHWQVNGVVTGGTYDNQNGCQPYPFAPCDHFGLGVKPKCPLRLYATPDCDTKCDNSSVNYMEEWYKGQSQYRMPSEENEIQLEILKNGPVTATLAVFSDFFHYKTGVYNQTSTSYQSMQAVRIIGWGVENGTKYWLAANSWNAEWGDKGFFKILRGANACGIETDIMAGMPDLIN